MTLPEEKERGETVQSVQADGYNHQLTQTQENIRALPEGAAVNMNPLLYFTPFHLACN